jgi:hypothetical protein
MSTKKDEPREGIDASRRNFLRAGIAGASVAAATGAAVSPVQAAESDTEKKKARYRETEHVKKYYATNRY